MNSNKLISPIIILGSLILTNCARTYQVIELSSEIQNVNKKVNKINNQIDLLQSEIEQNKNEVLHANKRLDNQAFFIIKKCYTKLTNINNFLLYFLLKGV